MLEKNKDVFYKVENNSGCSVFVLCNPKNKTEVKEYLENFGVVYAEEIVNRILISVDCDIKGYDELYDREEGSYFFFEE